MMLPRTRQEALASGSTLFFTGRECRHGHVSPRQTCSQSCVECIRLHKKSPKAIATAKAYYANNKSEFKANFKKFQETQKSERPWSGPIRASRIRAKERGLEHTLTSAWGKNVWTGRCAISGLPFRVDLSGTPGPKPFSPTIDRRDPLRGYVPDNCRFVLCCVNNFRGTLGDEEMTMVARAIVEASRVD